MCVCDFAIAIALYPMAGVAMNASAFSLFKQTFFQPYLYNLAYSSIEMPLCHMKQTNNWMTMTIECHINSCSISQWVFHGILLIIIIITSRCCRCCRCCCCILYVFQSTANYRSYTQCEKQHCVCVCILYSSIFSV